MSAFPPSEIIKKWSGPEKGLQPRGLTNPGALCYRISLLQCLFELISFNVHVSSLHPTCENSQDCLVCTFKKLRQKYSEIGATAEGIRNGQEKLDRVFRKRIPLTEKIRLKLLMKAKMTRRPAYTIYALISKRARPRGKVS